jgi:hypothetical protein
MLLRVFGFIAVLCVLTLTVTDVQPFGIWQDARRQELEQLIERASRHEWMVKASGSGAADVRSPSLNGIERAAWNDDQGVYLFSSLAAFVTSKNLQSDSVLYAGFYSSYLSSFFFLAFFLKRVLQRSFLAMFTSIAIFVISYNYIFRQLPMTVLGRNIRGGGARTEGLGIGDIFYAFQGSVSLLTICISLLVISHLKTLSKKKQCSGISLIAALLGISELFRSGSFLSVGLVVLVVLFGTYGFTRKSYGILGIVTIATFIFKRMVIEVSLIATQITSGISPSASRTGHGTYHNLYLGLSYTRSRLSLINGSPGNFGIEWNDNYLYRLAHISDPNMVFYSPQYEAMVRNLFWDMVSRHPSEVFASIFWRFIETVLMLKIEFCVFGVVAIALAVLSRFGIMQIRELQPQLWLLGLLGGMLGPVLTMPLYNYFGFVYVITGLYLLLGLISLLNTFVVRLQR